MAKKQAGGNGYTRISGFKSTLCRVLHPSIQSYFFILRNYPGYYRKCKRPPTHL